MDDFLESPTSGALPPAPSGVPLSHMQPPMAAAPMYHGGPPKGVHPPPAPAAPAYHAPPAAPMHAPPPVPAAPTHGRADWTAGCSRIVDNLIKILGPIDSPIFFNEVDPVAVRRGCITGVDLRLLRVQQAAREREGWRLEGWRVRHAPPGRGVRRCRLRDVCFDYRSRAELLAPLASAPLTCCRPALPLQHRCPTIMLWSSGLSA